MHPKQYQEQRGASLCGRKLRTPEAAEHLGVSPSTMAKWRLYGCGPPYSKLGSIVVYDLPDLDQFAAERRRFSTSESMGAA